MKSLIFSCCFDEILMTAKFCSCLIISVYGIVIKFQLSQCYTKEAIPCNQMQLLGQCDIQYLLVKFIVCKGTPLMYLKVFYIGGNVFNESLNNTINAYLYSS